MLSSADPDDTFDSRKCNVLTLAEIRLTLSAEPLNDSESRTNDLFDMSMAPRRKPPSRSRTTQPIVVDEDDEVVLKPRSKSKRQSQRELSPVHIQLQPLNNRRRPQKSKPIEPLFLESDEDAEIGDGDDDYHDTADKLSGGVINLSQDDDLDDGTTVPSAKSSQQTTTRPTRASARKKTTIRVQEGDSDDDDDVQYRGFGRKRR